MNTIESVSRGISEVERYLKALKLRIKHERFMHTLGVVEMAAQLAEIYHVDHVKVMVAAALHDYAKNLTNEQLLSLAERYELALEPVMTGSSELLHGPVGAELIREDFGIDDEDILNAIRYHTFGRSNMTMIEKIVYIADAIEPGRVYEGVKALRKKAQVDLDDAILDSARSTLQYVLVKGLPLHPNSVHLYNEMIMKKTKK